MTGAVLNLTAGLVFDRYYWRLGTLPAVTRHSSRRQSDPSFGDDHSYLLQQ